MESSNIKIQDSSQSQQSIICSQFLNLSFSNSIFENWNNNSTLQILSYDEIDDLWRCLQKNNADWKLQQSLTQILQNDYLWQQKIQCYTNELLGLYDKKYRTMALQFSKQLTEKVDTIISTYDKQFIQWKIQFQSDTLKDLNQIKNIQESYGQFQRFNINGLNLKNRKLQANHGKKRQGRYQCFWTYKYNMKELNELQGVFKDRKHFQFTCQILYFPKQTTQQLADIIQERKLFRKRNEYNFRQYVEQQYLQLNKKYSLIQSRRARLKKNQSKLPRLPNHYKEAQLILIESCCLKIDYHQNDANIKSQFLKFSDKQRSPPFQQFILETKITQSLQKPSTDHNDCYKQSISLIVNITFLYLRFYLKLKHKIFDPQKLLNVRWSFKKRIKTEKTFYDKTLSQRCQKKIIQTAKKRIYSCINHWLLYRQISTKEIYLIRLFFNYFSLLDFKSTFEEFEIYSNLINQSTSQNQFILRQEEKYKFYYWQFKVKFDIQRYLRLVQRFYSFTFLLNYFVSQFILLKKQNSVEILNKLYITGKAQNTIWNLSSGKKGLSSKQICSQIHTIFQQQSDYQSVFLNQPADNKSCKHLNRIQLRQQYVDLLDEEDNGSFFQQNTNITPEWVNSILQLLIQWLNQDQQIFQEQDSSVSSQSSIEGNGDQSDIDSDINLSDSDQDNRDQNQDEGVNRFIEENQTNQQVRFIQPQDHLAQTDQQDPSLQYLTQQEEIANKLQLEIFDDLRQSHHQNVMNRIQEQNQNNPQQQQYEFELINQQDDIVQQELNLQVQDLQAELDNQSELGFQDWNQINDEDANDRIKEYYYQQPQQQQYEFVIQGDEQIIQGNQQTEQNYIQSRVNNLYGSFTTMIASSRLKFEYIFNNFQQGNYQYLQRTANLRLAIDTDLLYIQEQLKDLEIRQIQKLPQNQIYLEFIRQILRRIRMVIDYLEEEQRLSEQFFNYAQQ